MNRIRKGDEVIVIAGKDKGRRGTVLQVFPNQRVLVEGVNVAKKHQRPLRATMQGGIIDKDMPIRVENVALLCPSCGPTRVGYRFDSDGTKVRRCKKCGKDL